MVAFLFGVIIIIGVFATIFFGYQSIRTPKVITNTDKTIQPILWIEDSLNNSKKGEMQIQKAQLELDSLNRNKDTNSH